MSIILLVWKGGDKCGKKKNVVKLINININIS